MIRDLSKCRVLLVDDVKTNIDVLIQALSNEYKLAVALNGERALEYAKKNALDLILLDIMMPEMDGFEVCQRLKEDSVTSEIPVIFITAKNASDQKTKGFEIGAVDYITKPFDIVEVKARVKTHLKLRLSQEALKKQNIILEEKVWERTRELAEVQREILDRLGLAAEQRDEETGQHIKRMCEYCRLLGSAAGLSDTENNILYQASTMHDVGKIGISDTILRKPSKLDREEFEIMKTHTVIGAKILSGSKSGLLQMAATISLTHHEKWDGTGYPAGLRGKDIPLVGRITCICDVFDALISERPYKKPWMIEKAFEEINAGKGSHFDPILVEHFCDLESELREIIRVLGLH